MSAKVNLLSVACVVLVSACGGGGDDSPAQPPQQKYSRDDLKQVAGVGIAMHQISGARTALLPAMFGGTIQGLASDTGGNRTIPLSCTSGTGSLQLSKTTAHTGLSAGDEITVTYSKCAVAKVILEGTAKLTVRAPVTPSVTGDMNTNFDVAMTAFAISNGVTADAFGGTANMRAASTGSLNSITSNITVPAGQTLTLAAGTSVKIDYQGGTSISATDTAVPGSGSRKLDGTLRILSAGVTRTYAIKAPAPLAGTLSSSGAFTPTSGVVESTDVERNLATSTTISGVNSQVSGDTDQNGSKDLTFTDLTSNLLQ